MYLFLISRIFPKSWSLYYMKQTSLMIRLAAYPEVDSISNGPGLRTVIWTQGCPHNCPGCHNPETHTSKGGKMVTARWITSKIPLYQDGITFSGGDPMCQPLSLIPVAIWAHKHSQNVWCYTGYRYETLLKSPTPVRSLTISMCW